MPSREGHGATLTAGTSSWTGDITGLGLSGVTREAIETTHLGTTVAESFIPSTLYNPGEFTVDVNFDPQTPPPFAGVAETWTITFPTSATYAASGFITDFSFGPAVSKELVSASFTIKLTGAITKANLP